MINKVTLVGNLGKDPEVRHLESGSSVARFSLATNESYRDKDGNWQTRTEWHVVVVWRALAERAERDLKRGSLVYIEGKLRTRSYQDSNGVEKSITEVEGQVLRALDRRERNDQSFPTSANDPSNFSSSSGSSPASNTPPAPSSSQPKLPDNDIADDDLPF